MTPKYSVIDIQTKGNNREGQKIIDIAIINFDGSEIEEVWSTLINPERRISLSPQANSSPDVTKSCSKD